MMVRGHDTRKSESDISDHTEVQVTKHSVSLTDVRSSLYAKPISEISFVNPTDSPVLSRKII